MKDDIAAIRDALAAGPTLELRTMNLRCDVEKNLPAGCGEAMAYKYGHRDARHALAEIAAEADERIARLLDALEQAQRRLALLERDANRTQNTAWKLA